MKNKLITITNLISALFFYLLFSTAVQAGAVDELKPQLTLKTVVEKQTVSIAGGKEIIQNVPAKDAKSGDIIVYTIYYKNDSTSLIKDAFIIDPIPQQTCYIDGSGTTDGISSLSFSLDSGNTYHEPPVMLEKKNADGKIEKLAAPSSSYTHIKWSFQKSLMPAQNGSITFKVKVN